MDVQTKTPDTTPVNAETGMTGSMTAPSASDEIRERWLGTVLKLRPDLRFEHRTQGKSRFVVIEDPVRSKFFQIGNSEFEFIAAVDGVRSAREIAASIADDTDQRLNDDQIVSICQWLLNCNLVFGDDVDNTKRLEIQAAARGRQQLLGLINPISFKFKLFNPNSVLTRILPLTGWFFSKWFLIAWAALAIVALNDIWSHWHAVEASSFGILAGGRWAWLLIVWVAMKIIHETAHGLACRKFGGEVPEAGVLMLLFTPMAYVNVTSSWRFASRWQRMAVAGAGMYIELFVAMLAFVLWARLDPGIARDICFNVFITGSVTTILFNANPLMRFDGYYILSDLVGIPNLYPKGTRWTGEHLKALVFGTPVATNICPPAEQRKVAAYGICAFFWKFIITFSLVIGASVMFNGAGIALAAIGICFWFGIPLYRNFQSLFGQQAKHKVNRKRLTISIATAVLLALSMFVILRGPATKSAPAIVQFKDEVILRAGADGFIRNIAVADGQAVRKGEILIELENDALNLEVTRLKNQLEKAEIQIRIYRQTGESALVISETKNLESIRNQLREKQDQAAGLAITAPDDGFVYARNLGNRIGSYVRRGDVVLNFAQKQTKEIVVTIDQADLESIKGNEGESLRVAFPGVNILECRLERINPRASDVPRFPSLCATSDGPLAVKPAPDGEKTDEASFVLLSPRFTAELAVNDESGSLLHSGQRGRAFFKTRQQSLGSWLYVAAERWLEEKIQTAAQSSVF